LGKPIEILIPENVAAAHKSYRKEYTSKPESRMMGAGRDLVAISKSGRRVPVEIGLRPIAGDGGLRVAAFIVNIETRVQQAELNSRHDRLDAVGFLAAGLAHDYNNILSAILGNVEMLSLSLGEHPDQQRIETLRRLVRKGSDLAHRLMTFSRGDLPIYQQFDLLPLVRETTETCLAGTSVSSHFSYLTSEMLCKADKKQIAQIVVNVVINAVQAMPNGGHLHVTAEIADAPPSLPSLAGSVGHLVFRDDGPGIPEPIRARIFDPFVTTKALGNGLGLTMVHLIATKHGGAVTIDSEQGNGTSVHLFFPLSKEKPVAVSEPAPALLTTCAEEGRILVMDDDPDVLEAMTAAFRSCGYDVVECTGGGEALEAFFQANVSRRPFTAVVLDLTIPGKMGGAKVAQLIRERSPSVPIILISGYTEENVAHLLKSGVDRYLHKPFDLAELIQAVVSMQRP
jgi:signal transduction histidine kinase/ActR/RegA family two-component response regulator